MKIVHLATMDFGGAGKAASRLSEGLRAAGVDSTLAVLCGRTAAPGVVALPPRGIRERFPRAANCATRWKRLERHWRMALSPYPRRPSGLELFTDALAEYRSGCLEFLKDASLVNLHWIAGFLGFPAAAADLRGRKVVWTLHDMNPFTGGCHYSGTCERYVGSCGACPQLGSDKEDDLSRRGWSLKRDGYAGLDVTVVTPSRWLARRAAESTLLGSFPVEVIPNGIPVDVYRPIPLSRARQDIGLPAGRPVVLFGSAGDTRRKGFHLLASALSQLPEPLRRDVVLASFGPMPRGELSPEIEARHFGPVGDEQTLARIYCAADVFVIPSEEDNLPNTVIEALASGLPVAGFRIGGIPDMVAEGDTGCLAEPGDAAALAEAIVKVMSWSRNPGARARCRARAEAEYSLDVQARRYLGLYSALSKR